MSWALVTTSRQSSHSGPVTGPLAYRLSAKTNLAPEDSAVPRMGRHET